MDREAYERAQHAVAFAAARMAGICGGMIEQGAIPPRLETLVRGVLAEYEAAIAERNDAMKAWKLQA